MKFPIASHIATYLRKSFSACIRYQFFRCLTFTFWRFSVAIYLLDFQILKSQTTTLYVLNFWELSGSTGNNTNNTYFQLVLVK